MIWSNHRHTVIKCHGLSLMFTCFILKSCVVFLLFMSCLVSCSSVSHVLISLRCFSPSSVFMFVLNSCSVFPHQPFVSRVPACFPTAFLYLCSSFSFLSLDFHLLDRLYVNKTRICSVTCLSVCLTFGSLFV